MLGLKDLIRLRIVWLVVFWCTAAPILSAQEEVLLTLEIADVERGMIEVTEFTRTDLSALPVARFGTSTNWTDGIHSFQGVMLSDLLESVEINQGEMELIALNGYRAYLSISDPTVEGAMIAYLMDDAPMTRRDKGPLWLIYNFDADPDFRREIVLASSIWQLNRIVVSN